MGCGKVPPGVKECVNVCPTQALFLLSVLRGSTLTLSRINQLPNTNGWINLVSYKYCRWQEAWSLFRVGQSHHAFCLVAAVHWRRKACWGSKKKKIIHTSINFSDLPQPLGCLVLLKVGVHDDYVSSRNSTWCSWAAVKETEIRIHYR